MKTTSTEIEIKVSGAKVTNAMLMPDGTCKLTIEMANTGTMVTKVKDDEFVLVEASKLSMNDKFMQYEYFGPKCGRVHIFKMLLERVIKSGLKDFRRPKYDPSFKENGICYESGKAPAVGKSYDWWNQVAKKFKPEYNSRLGTKTEYVAFLGVLIKKLVESGWSVENALHAVCIDSRKLGHYRDSKNANKHEYESTGRREICGFYDLGNCCKILAAEEEEFCQFLIAGGYYVHKGCNAPLADIERHVTGHDINRRESVGWIVLD